MASATSSVSQVKTGTSVRNRKTLYYKTQVTTLADGSIKRETYRTDSKGSPGSDVKISEATVDKDGNITAQSVTSNATTNEKRALQQPNSQLSTTIKQQTKQAGDQAQANSVDPGGALEKAGGGSGNSANNPEQGDSQAAPEVEPPTPPSNLRYPVTMPDDQDVIQFTALKYEAKELQGLSFGARDRVTVGGGGSRSVGTVTLPIQSGIKDANAAGWGEDEMNPLQIAGLDIATGAIGGGIDGVGQSLNRVSEQVSSATPELKTALTGIFASKAVGVKNVLARTEGVIINPNLELLFQKPALRPFSFSFRLSPRSKDEADEIIQIIRFFKKNMAPQRGGGSGGESANLFLRAPNTFQVHYLLAGGEEHKYIGMMKECAMTAFNVDYTPENNYATLKDGYMASYVITMTMKELEPVFFEDYDGDDVPTDAIGF